VQSPIHGCDMEARVKELIDQNTKWWNSNLISATFLEEEAKVIMNMPLSPLQPRDRLIWRCTSTGDITVQSAYHMGMEMDALSGSGGSKKGEGSCVWKICWMLNIPKTVQLFLWRALNNLLPTKSNLFLGV
jgi:hypothetical protein